MSIKINLKHFFHNNSYIWYKQKSEWADTYIIFILAWKHLCNSCYNTHSIHFLIIMAVIKVIFLPPQPPWCPRITNIIPFKCNTNIKIVPYQAHIPYHSNAFLSQLSYPTNIERQRLKSWREGKRVKVSQEAHYLLGRMWQSLVGSSGSGSRSRTGSGTPLNKHQGVQVEHSQTQSWRPQTGPKPFAACSPLDLLSHPTNTLL